MKQIRFASGDKKQVSFYFSRKKYNEFKEKFPNLTTFFLTKCLECALEKQGFVSSVLLKDFSSLEVEK